VSDEDLVALRVGTQEVPRVEGARPPLFGTEPEAEPAAGPRPASPAPAAPAPAPPAPVAPSAPVAVPTVPPGASAEAPGTAPEAGPASQATAPPADARPVTVLFSPPEVALRVGQSGGLAVVLVGARDVQSVEINLAWDPALAEVADVAAGSLLTLDGSPVSAERAVEGGRARVRFSRATGATGSGAVVAVTMKGLKAGSGSVVVESMTLGRGGASERLAPPAPGRLVVAP
jgi:general secretion pathway protein D